MRRILSAALLLLALPASPSELRGPGLEEGEAIRIVRLENVGAADASTVLRSMLGIRNLATLEESQTILLRDSEERLRLAAELLAEIDRPSPGVSIDLRILSFDIEGGAPDSLSLGSRLTGPQAERLFAAAGITELARLRLDATAGKSSRLLLGERVPIQVGGEHGVQYQDVGLQIEVAPRVHRDSGEITLDVRLASSRRTDESESQPVIQAGTVDVRLRLHDGESRVFTDLILDHPEVDGDVVLVLTPSLMPTT